MKRIFECLTVVCIFGGSLLAMTAAISAQEPDPNVVGGPQLESPPVEAEQPSTPVLQSPAIPPAPGPADANAETQATPEPTAEDPDVAAADGYLVQGRLEQAVQAASRALVRDPNNPAARSIRAEAYKQMGRFEEGLADQKPLEIVVGAPQAELKTGRTVLAVVSGGTKLLVDDVRGNWLKVISAGDRQYDWAWIHKANLAPAPGPSDVDVSIRGGISIPGEGLRVEIRGRADRMAEPPYGYYYVDPHAGYYYYGPRRHDYGRRHYDWWQHVPPQYWGYLPR